MQEFDEELFRTDTAALKVFNDQIIEEFRANDGKVGVSSRIMECCY